MQKLFVRNTRVAPVYIARQVDGTFHALIGDESLGAYATPQKAAEDLAGGRTFSNSLGVDTATLGIPADLNEWEPVKS